MTVAIHNYANRNVRCRIYPSMKNHDRSDARATTRAHLTSAALDDMAELDQSHPGTHEAALAALDGLVHRRITGAALREHERVGDLRGLWRVKFDLPGVRPQAYRLVYEFVVDANQTVIAIVAVGPRNHYEVYFRAAVRRATAPSTLS